MSRRRIAAWLAGAALVLIAGAAGVAATSRSLDLPPSGGVALEAILRSMERRDMGFIQSAEYERDWWRTTGYWEITVCREACIKHYVDPRTGEEHKREAEELDEPLPSADTRGPAAIAKALGAKKAVVTEIEFKHGAWHAKYHASRGFLDALKPAERRTFDRVSFERRPPPRRSVLPAPVLQIDLEPDKDEQREAFLTCCPPRR